MLKTIFIFITIIHGLIHFMGFAKAYNYGNITQITKHISKPVGSLWLVTAILFLVAVLLFLLKKESWTYIAIIAAIISQILIITEWKDARFGTIANVIVVLVGVAAWASFEFESKFTQDVKVHLRQTKSNASDLLLESDIKSLPLPVQTYMRYCGVIGKPKVNNMKIVFDGQMRDKGKAWFTLTSVQYNFFNEPTRLFFMKARMFGITLPGYHRYENKSATMQIKLFGLFNVVNVKGIEMNQAETVTVFNDMCLMAPSTMIDKRITWASIDDLSAKASFINGVNKISAILYFNNNGHLINFTSDDRYAVSEMKQCRFSTPVKDYTKINEHTIWTYGEAIWHYPDGEFVYGKFTLKSIEYNVTTLKQ